MLEFDITNATNISATTFTGDLTGSVFGDDSTLLVDGVAGKIVGDIETDSLTIGGTGFVNFNNDAQDDTFYGGATTDKSILLLKGADYLAGSDDGGGVIISGGAARNGGNNGDIIIASGGGGAEGTGYISLLSANITASGTWIGRQIMDIKGSVFGDDSTLLVDGVNGIIPASVLDGDTTLGIIEASQLVAGTDQSISLGYKDFNGDGHSLLTLSEANQIRIWGDVSVPNPAGTTIDFNNCTIQNLYPGSIRAKDGEYLYIMSAFDSGLSTNVGFIYDTDINNVRQVFYGKTEFGNNGQAPIVDFTGATVTGMDDLSVGGDLTVADKTINTPDTSTGGANSGTATALDVTKTLQVLNSADGDDNWWSLADGTEGQIMHFVPGTGAGTDQHIVTIENWRRWDSDAGDAGEWVIETNLDWLPFKLDFDGTRWTGVATAIFANGAWQTNNPWID
jgi:hypothetical protein